MSERLMMRQRWCYKPVMTWDPPATADLPKGSRGPWYIPCKKPVFRALGHGTKDGKRIEEWVCFDHSPNARRPKPEGR